MSFASYNVPITKDGTLPVRLFGEKLNIKRLQEKKIPWLICYGTEDDLVEKETALAPLDFIDAEVTPFPKGHVAIATSWSSPDSACALHKRFGDGKYRGPVLFHMDLDAALNKAAGEASAKAKSPSKEAKPTSTARVQPKTRAATKTLVKKTQPVPETTPKKNPGESVVKVENLSSAIKKPVKLAEAETLQTAPQKKDTPKAPSPTPALKKRDNKP